ncbi:MAG: hypothetical protein NZ772_16800 [Cyanobacteria bacterium]|nr:hypothetical protein [Cyanobacteriota bacterium]MDW8202988.1 hypothetical protein [Cyanobacteriota bacterium SKYGB_h_bin112]
MTAIQLSPTVVPSISMSDYTNLAQAQELIYEYFLQIIRQKSSTEVLVEFRQLIIHCQDVADTKVLTAFYSILLSNQEVVFRNTLKRCCYILVNHWELHRCYSQIQALVYLFADELIQRSTSSSTLRQLRRWLKHFIQSSDYQDLCLFAFRHGVLTAGDPWVDRYHTYRLVYQAVDPHNPVEQRRAAHIAAAQLKQRFKFELAMYTARCQTIKGVGKEQTDCPRNPTQLGDEVLWLVKTIVAQQGQFRHQTLARLFLQEVKDVNYQTFKTGLMSYITYSVDSQPFTQAVRSKLMAKLTHFQVNQNHDPVNQQLLVSTCEYLVDCFTCEDGESPAALFHLFQIQSLPLTLVMVLLKLVLIAPQSRMHLEARLSQLIQHYSVLHLEACQSFVTFLEVLQVAFAICCEDVEYNLVEMPYQSGAEGNVTSLDHYRLFSQWKRKQP